MWVGSGRVNGGFYDFWVLVVSGFKFIRPTLHGPILQPIFLAQVVKRFPFRNAKQAMLSTKLLQEELLGL